MIQTKSSRAFTLIELLVVIAIIGIIAAISLPLYSRFMTQARETKTVSNMRQIGAAVLLYAADNSQQLPNRVADGAGAGASGNKWPTALKPYVQDTNAFTSPIPPLAGVSYNVVGPVPPNYFDNTKNYTSYIYNGLNDMGAYSDATVTPRLNLIDQASQTILFGIPVPLSNQFYMDFKDNDNQTGSKAVLNRTAFPDGCPYVFGDGSTRVLSFDTTSSTAYKTSPPPTSNTYSDWYWLLNKNQTSIIQ